MSKLPEIDEYVEGLRVRIVGSTKPSYKNLGLLRREGTVKCVSSKQIGVVVDDCPNNSSRYGVFWFRRSELKIIDEKYVEQKEIRKMSNKVANDYRYVASVRLLNNKAVYDFALFDEDYDMLEQDTDLSIIPGQLVVVNPVSSTNTVLGEVVSVSERTADSTNCTAEVVGVVLMDRYRRKVEEARIQVAMETTRKEIDAELERLSKASRSSQYYSQFVSMYPENEGLKKLVDSLKELEQSISNPGDRSC